MNLIELAQERLSKKALPLEKSKPEDEIHYCSHNLIVGVCKYCAANELGELVRAGTLPKKKSKTKCKAYDGQTRMF